MNIIKVIPKDDFKLYIQADDGREGLFDVKPYLASEAFEPLMDKGEFSKIYNGGYFIEWDCGCMILCIPSVCIYQNIHIQ